MAIFRPGRNEFGSNTPYDNWLPVFGGEILTAFQEYNQFLDKVDHKTITSGTELQFIMSWKIGSEVHETGAELLGLDVETAKRSIYLDDRPLVTHFYTDDIDKLMSHYDLRSEIVSDMSRELARQIDRRIAKLLILASRTSAPGGSFYGGGYNGSGGSIVKSNTASDTDAGALDVLAAIDTAVVRYAQIDAPMDMPTFCCVRPGLWNRLRNLGQLVSSATVSAFPMFGHRDIDQKNPQIQQGMGISDVLTYKGVSIVQSNHLPTTNIQDGSRYAGNFSATTGIIWKPKAVAHLQMLGVTVETGRDFAKQLDGVIAKTLTGGGTLRPELAMEITSS